MSGDSAPMNAGSADGTASLTTMTRADVIRWWELRRIPYNLALLLIGATSLGVAIFPDAMDDR